MNHMFADQKGPQGAAGALPSDLESPDWGKEPEVNIPRASARYAG